MFRTPGNTGRHAEGGHAAREVVQAKRQPCEALAARAKGDNVKNKVKASSYIARYPVLRTVQSALHFTSLTDLFTQTPSWLLWEASSHTLQLMHEDCLYTYPLLSIARYSFTQLSELE